jgi:hypothetical protein
LSAEDSQNGENHFRRSPTGPAIAPPRVPVDQAPPQPAQAPRRKRHFWSVAIFILLASGVLIRAYGDLSRPEAWDYWKDQYVSPSLTSQVIDTLYLDGSSQGRRALFVSGTIGPAAANWFRGRLDQANLAAGDIVLLASPGGDLNQAAIMGEIIRSRSLATAVGSADAAARLLRQRLRGGLCRRQDPLRRIGLGIGRSSVCHNQARRRPGRGGPAGCRRGAGLHDQNGGLVHNRGSDVRDQGDPLA